MDIGESEFGFSYCVLYEIVCKTLCLFLENFRYKRGNAGFLI